MILLGRALRSGLVAIALVAMGLAASCSSDPASETTPGGNGPPDSGTIKPPDNPDPGGSDGGTGADGGDGGDGGSTPTGDILGTLSGSCGVVKTLLTTTSPSFETNLLAFVAGEKYEQASLSPDGQKIYTTPNAGGSSTESEVMSFEVLRYCEGAKLVKTETEVKYAPADGGPASITDILVEISGKKVGVSVTRAYKPPSQTLSDADVKSLLEKKFQGINVSSQRVLPEDKWVKQVLHVFAANKAAAEAVARVLPSIDASLKADTVVLLTQTTGGGFVYCNPDPPLGSECQ
jgi:hypothetical protein